jgi:hypothetical protein
MCYGGHQSVCDDSAQPVSASTAAGFLADYRWGVTTASIAAFGVFNEV